MKKSAKNGSSHGAVITALGKKLYEMLFVQNSDLTASLVKSTAVSSGGMAFECLEVDISEVLIFISIFLRYFELVCGWLQTKVVVCLLSTCFSKPFGY